MHPIESWLLELLKLFIRYMAVAFCSIPATLVYFLVLKAGGSSNWAMTASLLIGFSCAYLAWDLLEKRTLRYRLPDLVKTERTIVFPGLALNPATADIVYSIGGPHLAVGFAAKALGVGFESSFVEWGKLAPEIRSGQGQLSIASFNASTFHQQPVQVASGYAIDAFAELSGLLRPTKEPTGFGSIENYFKPSQQDVAATLSVVVKGRLMPEQVGDDYGTIGRANG